MDESVSAFCAFNGTLIASGLFTVPASRIAQWNGATWSALGSGIRSGNVFTLLDYRGVLAIGGGFQAAGSVSVNFTAIWDGVAWSALGSGMSFPVQKLLENRNNGNLIAGGDFSRADGRLVDHLAEWNGASWVGFAAGGTDEDVDDIVYFRDTLVIGGTFTTAGNASASRVAQLSAAGDLWLPLGSGMAGGEF